MVTTILLWLAVALLVVAGLVGLVFPALPGAPLLFLGLWLAAWAENFAFVGAGTLVALGLMAALTYVVELMAAAMGSRRFGASPYALWGAVIGGFAGLFAWPIGIFVGPFVGAVVGELYATGGLRQAGRAGIGATLGFALGLAGKVTLGFAMVGVFLVRRFLGD